VDEIDGRMKKRRPDRSRTDWSQTQTARRAAMAEVDGEGDERAREALATRGCHCRAS